MASNKIGHLAGDFQTYDNIAEQPYAGGHTSDDHFRDEQVEKFQPWKAGWIARNKGGVEKPETKGVSHGTEVGGIMVIGGFTSGVAVKMTPTKS
ncbi:uncharacterized protein TrAtP1_010049 [Trichoderma atroviride]|uniref:uncharacterized protein n=1 Tax=Hypocrea atroviridis TaxID=63577 RepID=UPI00332BA61C|nr:hypothetical protein TrAtP1_010049 [Trichoderma atroviride]